MKAIRIVDDKLVWSQAETPVVKAGEVLVKTAASAVNRADLAQRSGRYPPPPGASDILGLECSGTIVEKSPEVTDLEVGDEVCALLSGGGYAEFVAVPATHTLPIPKGYSLEQAGGLPEVLATAWLNLRLEAALQPGERVLVHAGASGVGTASIQLCRAWANPVWATVGNSEKVQICKELGAVDAFDRNQGPWLEGIRAVGGVDVILDPVGAAYLADNILALRPRGRLINIGLLGGQEGKLPMGPVLVKRLSLKGSVLRSRSWEEKNLVIQGLLREVWPLLENGQVRLIVDQVFPVEEAEQAHARIESNQSIGKVLLRMP